MKKLLLIITFVLIGHSIVIANTNIIDITNKLNITIEITAESLSDLEYSIINPKNTQSFYKLQQNSGKGDNKITLPLGKIRDDSSQNCLSENPDTLRRIGICEDGNYTINIQSTDAAGNKSQITQHIIERDTVSPNPPIVEDPYICDQNICIKIYGEKDANIFINGQYKAISSTNPKILVIKNNWIYETSYQFEIKLVDKANNHSDIIYKQIDTPLAGLGDGNMFGEENISKFPISRFDVSIDMSNGDYFINNIIIPPPVLTHIHTEIDNNVTTYGVAVPKNHSLEVNITKKYLSFVDAFDKCNITTLKVLILSESEKNCIQNAMGIDSIIDWYIDISKQCYISVPIYTQVCILDKQYNLKINKNEGKKMFSIEHSKVNLYNKSENNFNLGHIWNDNSDGRFTINTYLTNSKINDNLHARTIIFGSFNIENYNIDYRGISKDDAKNNKGLFSSYSNIKTVQKPRNVYNDPVGFPFRNFKLFGSGNANYFGTSSSEQICNKIGCTTENGRSVLTISRGGNESGHGPNAIDFGTSKSNYSSNIPPIVVSTMEGEITTYNKSNYNYVSPIMQNGKLVCPSHARPLYVKVASSKSNYNTLYLHLDPSSTQLKSWSKSSVYRGTPIGFIGNTGCSTGAHLHYAINPVSDPQKLYALITDKRGLDILPEQINYIQDHDAIMEYERIYMENKKDKVVINF
jgi:hypothetical protein